MFFQKPGRGRKIGSRGFRLFEQAAVGLVMAGHVVAAAHAQNASPQIPQAQSAIPAAVPPSPAPISGYVLPFTPLKEHGGPIVRVRLNNKVDANFFVDTGTNFIIIRSNLVKKLGLTTKSVPAPDHGNFATPGTRVEYVTIDSFNVGGIPSRGECVVSDQAVDLVPNQAIDGFIGANFLRLFAVVFNFEQKQMLFIPHGNLNDAQLSRLGVSGGVAAALPLKAKSPGVPLFTVPAFVDETRSFPLLIDTGSPNSLLLDAFAKGENRGVTSTMQTMNGALPYKMLPTTSFSVGSAEPYKRRYSVSPFEVGVLASDTKSGTSHEALLGLNYLSRFQVILDYPAQRLYLTPVANPAQYPFPTESSQQSAVLRFGDAVFIPSAQGKWAVTALEKEGLFGKAGLQVGDVFEKINGASPDGRLPNGVLSLLHTSQDPDDLQFRRDGKFIAVKLQKTK